MRWIPRGNKSVTVKWKGFAEARLRDMKVIMNALGLDYMRKPYRLPDADLVVESRYGLDSAWIVGRGFMKTNVFIDVLGISVSILVPGITIGGKLRHIQSHLFIGIFDTIDFDITSFIWDEDMNVLYTGETVNWTSAFGSSFISAHSSINAAPIDASNARYYGVLFELNSGNADLEFIGHNDTSGNTTDVYKHNGALWVNTAPNKVGGLNIQFSGHVVPLKTAEVGSGNSTGFSGEIALSPSISSSRYAVQIFSSSVVHRSNLVSPGDPIEDFLSQT